MNCDDNCRLVVNPDQSDNDADGWAMSATRTIRVTTAKPFDAMCEYARTPGPFAPREEWKLTVSSAKYPEVDQVMMTPAVANLNDDNGDGVIDTDDIPDIIFAAFTTQVKDPGWDNLAHGVLFAASGDGSGLLPGWEVGHEELGLADGGGIQPAGSVAVGDIDGDGCRGRDRACGTTPRRSVGW